MILMLLVIVSGGGRWAKGAEPSTAGRALCACGPVRPKHQMKQDCALSRNIRSIFDFSSMRNVFCGQVHESGNAWHNLWGLIIHNKSFAIWKNLRHFTFSCFSYFILSLFYCFNRIHSCRGAQLLAVLPSLYILLFDHLTQLVIIYIMCVLLSFPIKTHSSL